MTPRFNPNGRAELCKQRIDEAALFGAPKEVVTDCFPRPFWSGQVRAAFFGLLQHSTAFSASFVDGHLRWVAADAKPGRVFFSIMA